MAAFTFDAIYFSLVVFLSAIIPGVAIGWPLLKKTDFGAMEKALLSFFLGLFAVPTLLFLESFIGIKFSLFLVFVNIFIITAAGLFIGVRDGTFKLQAPEIPLPDGSFFTYERAVALAVPALLLLAVFLAFWIRIQTFSPIYSELDPYYYVYGSAQIIREGIQPVTDDTSWWPEVTVSHRQEPLKEYVEAEWYALYTNGAEYNNYLFFTTASWFPPISAAFVSFGAYLLVSSFYGRRYGLFAAFLLAFLPITIYKMSAGVNEAAPVGNMVLFMAMGLFAMSLMKKSNTLHLLSAIGFFIAVLSSNFASVVALPLAGLAILQSLDYFWRGKKSNDFVMALAFAVGGFLIGVILTGIYGGSLIGSLTSGPVLMALGGLAFALVVQRLIGLGWNDKKRYYVIGAAVIISILLVVATPVGGFAKKTVSGYIGAAEFKVALERTIAEQNLAGSSFEGEAGFIALVPKNYIEANASGLGIISNLIYMALSLIAALFTLVSNALFSLTDAAFNILVGMKQTTGTKEDSLFFVFLTIAVIGLALRHFTRKHEAREIPSIPLLILLVTMPVLYIGINKIKYTIFAGMMIAVAAAVALAELERFFRYLASKTKIMHDGPKYVSVTFAFLLLLVVYEQAAGPAPYAYIFTIKSLEPRYQDNPIAMMPAVSKLCEDLRAKGVPYNQIQQLCDAGAYANFSNSINNQFDVNVCWMSQMKVEELFPASDTTSQRRSSEAVTSAKFRCNRISDYWIDSMEWINKNLNTSDRVTSWWDYGHWTNYFGDRNTVLRNDHASLGMIGRVAHDYIIGNAQDLIDSMNYFDSRYALFDVELIGGSTFGGKYGALNYLGCVHEGATSLDEQPGTSTCEYNHSPERIVIPRTQTAANSCTISESQQRTGVYAYRLGKEAIDQSTPIYCVGDATIATGEKISATYYVDRKDANGDLVLSKGIIRVIDEQTDVIYAEMVYNNQKVWYGQNGTLVDGMEDAKTGFYTSNLYRGYYLGEIPGFDLVYTSKNGEVKIYRLQNFTGNKAGWIDPIASKRQN
ncbi:MAG: hypothetical protein WCY41_01375 [Candidatus Micrarchaeia archaeon]